MPKIFIFSNTGYFHNTQALEPYLTLNACSTCPTFNYSLWGGYVQNTPALEPYPTLNAYSTCLAFCQEEIPPCPAPKKKFH